MANDQEIARLVIKLVADVADIKNGLKDVQADVQKFSTTTQSEVGKVGSAWAMLKSNWLGAVGAIYAGYRTVQKAMSLLEEGARAEAIKESFSIMTRSMGIDGDKLIAQMQKAGVVFVDTTELMVKAQRLLVEGVTPAQIVKLMEAARIAARLMGTSVAEAFDLISESVITLRTRGLKAAFPMDVTETVRKFAEQLRTVPGLMNDAGQRAAILGQILEMAAGRGKMLGDSLASETNFEKIQKFRSAIKQINEDIGIKMLPLIGLAASVFAQWASWIYYVVGGINGLNVAYHELDSVLPGFLKNTLGMSKYTKEQNLALVESYKRSYKADIELADKLQQQSTRAMDNSLDMIEKLGEKPKTIAVFDVDEAKTKEQMEKVSAEQFIKATELQDKVSKVRREYSVKTAQAQVELAAVGLEEEKNQATQEYISMYRDLSLVEDRAAIESSDAKLKATKKSLIAEEKAAVEQTYKELGQTSKVGEAISAIKEYYLIQDSIAVQRNLNEKEAITIKKAKEIADAEFKAIQGERGITPEMEPFTATAKEIGEMDVRSQEFLVFRQKMTNEFKKQLTEVAGTYDQMTNLQVTAIETEGKEYRLTADFAKLSSTQQAEYNNLIDTRITKLKEAREAEKSTYVATLNLQLAEVGHQYNEITKKQIESLEAERKAALVTVEGRSNAEAVNRLYDERILKLKETRELEQIKDLSEMRRQLAEVSGDWKGMKQAEIESLDAELALTLATKDLTSEQRTLLIQINERRKAELQAAKDLDSVKLAMQGLRDFNMQVNQEMVDTFKNILPDSIKAFSDQFKNYLDKGKFDFKAFTESIRQLWLNVITKMMERNLTDLLTGIIGGGKGAEPGLLTKAISGLGSLIGLGGKTPAATVPTGPMETAPWVMKTGGGTLGESAAEIAKGIAPVSTIAKTVSPAADALKLMDLEMQKKPTDIAGVVKGLTDMDGQLITAKSSIENLSKKQLPDLGTSAESLARGPLPSIRGSFDDLEGNIPDVSTDLSSAISEINLPPIPVDSLTDGFDGFFDMTSSGVSGMDDDFGHFFGSASSDIQGLGGLFDDVIGSLVGGGKGGGGGGILGMFSKLFGFKAGGPIRGPEGTDNILIRASKDEFMQPAPAVRYYSEKFMEDIRQRKIPRELLEIVSMIKEVSGLYVGTEKNKSAQETYSNILAKVLNLDTKENITGTVGRDSTLVQSMTKVLEAIHDRKIEKELSEISSTTKEVSGLSIATKDSATENTLIQATIDVLENIREKKGQKELSEISSVIKKTSGLFIAERDISKTTDSISSIKKADADRLTHLLEIDYYQEFVEEIWRSKSFAEFLETLSRDVKRSGLIQDKTSETYASHLMRVLGYEGGGKIIGPGGPDAIHIRATKDEFMQPVPAVKLYGEGVMEAIRQRKIPPELLRAFAIAPSRPSESMFFQTGGQIRELGSAGGRNFESVENNYYYTNIDAIDAQSFEQRMGSTVLNVVRKSHRLKGVASDLSR